MSLIARVNQLEREVNDYNRKIRLVHLEIKKLSITSNTSDGQENLFHLQRVLEDFFPFLK